MREKSSLLNSIGFGLISKSLIFSREEFVGYGSSK